MCGGCAQTLRQNTEVPVERHASTRKEIATQTQGLVITQASVRWSACALTAINTSMKGSCEEYTVGSDSGEPA